MTDVRGLVRPDDDDEAEISSASDFLRAVAFVPRIHPPFLERDRTGEVMGRFEITSLLGRGGMGVVYAARDRVLRRDVALKLLLPEALSSDERRRRFLREARVAAAVSHPSLAAIFEAGEIDGEVFIAMERVEGCSLRSFLEERGPALPEAEATEIAVAIARGLAAAHAASVIHRDIKPENVMVSAGSRVKILDFGIAKMHVAADEGVHPAASALSTHAGAVLGSPGYMSPEQARGLPVDARADVFAFGVVLFEMLAGERPFQGATVMDMLAAIMRDEAPPLAAKRPGVDPSLAAVVARCLAKDPNARFQHAGELLAALEAKPPAAPESPRPSRRLRTAAAVLCVGLAGVAAAVSFQPSPTPSPTRVTDLPLPHARRAEALDAYKDALKAFRDANWGRAEDRLREAVAFDPSLAEAHLRLAFVLSPPGTTSPSNEARAEHGEASKLREALTPRDRDLLAALDPAFQGRTADIGGTARRLEAMTTRYPFDAELWNLLALSRSFDTPERRSEAAQRALDLDPEYADALQQLGTSLAETDPHKAVEILRRGINLPVISPDCLGELAYWESATGDCKSADLHLKQATHEPDASWYSYRDRAEVLYGRGEKRDVVADMLRQKRKRVRSRALEEDELYDRALLSAAYGDFDTARRDAEQGLATVDAQASLSEYTRFTVLLVDIGRESGHADLAAAAAAAFLRRHDALQPSAPMDDPLVYLRRVVERSPIPVDLGPAKADLRATRDAWYSAAKGGTAIERALVWSAAFARGIESEREAREALSAMPEGARWSSPRFPSLAMDLGRVYFQTGNIDKALPHLESAYMRCYRFADVFAMTRSDLLYGLALEERGRTEEACGVYRSIHARWGEASPPSVTATQAKERALALGCDGFSR